MKEKIMNEDDESLKELFKKIYDEFKQQVNDNGKVLIPFVGEHLISLEALSLAFSNCIIEDIDMIMELKEQNINHRYADGIIRNICEQVIEFIYIYKNPDKLSEYFGDKTDEEYKKLEKDSDIFMAIRKSIGDKRYTGGRKIKNMATNINEVEERDGALSLYGVYQYTSTVYHNSYLCSIFDLVGEVEEEDGTNENDSEDIDFLMMVTILIKFIDKYNEIVSHLGL